MKDTETGGVITRMWERLGDFAQICTIYKRETAASTGAIFKHKVLTAMKPHTPPTPP